MEPNRKCNLCGQTFANTTLPRLCEENHAKNAQANTAYLYNVGLKVERIDAFMLCVTQMASGNTFLLSLDQFRALRSRNYDLAVVLGGFSHRPIGNELEEKEG